MLLLEKELFTFRVECRKLFLQLQFLFLTLDPSKLTLPCCLFLKLLGFSGVFLPLHLKSLLLLCLFFHAGKLLPKLLFFGNEYQI